MNEADEDVYLKSFIMAKLAVLLTQVNNRLEVSNQEDFGTFNLRLDDMHKDCIEYLSKQNVAYNKKLSQFGVQLKNYAFVSMKHSYRNGKATYTIQPIKLIKEMVQREWIDIQAVQSLFD